MLSSISRRVRTQPGSHTLVDVHWDEKHPVVRAGGGGGLLRGTGTRCWDVLNASFRF